MSESSSSTMSESSSSTKCFNCDSFDSIIHSYPWLYTPKAKYVAEQLHLDEFTVKLCNLCHEKATTQAGETGIIVMGWDWWDAADYLDYQYLQPQEYRDHWDKRNAETFGFSSVEQLRGERKIRISGLAGN